MLSESRNSTSTVPAKLENSTNAVRWQYRYRTSKTPVLRQRIRTGTVPVPVQVQFLYNAGAVPGQYRYRTGTISGEDWYNTSTVAEVRTLVQTTEEENVSDYRWWVR